MSDYDRKEWVGRLAEKSRKRIVEAMPAMRTLQAAGVIMAKITTGSDEWNRYLSYLQGFIDKSKAAKQAAQDAFADPGKAWLPHEQAKLKADIITAGAMIDAWAIAMQLPKALVDGGAEATEFLNKLDRENAEIPGQAQS